MSNCKSLTNLEFKCQSLKLFRAENCTLNYRNPDVLSLLFADLAQIKKQEIIDVILKYNVYSKDDVYLLVLF